MLLRKNTTNKELTPYFTRRVKELFIPKGVIKDAVGENVNNIGIYSGYSMNMYLYVKDISRNLCYFADYHELERNLENLMCYTYSKKTGLWSWRKFKISVKPTEFTSKTFYTFNFREATYEDIIKDLRLGVLGPSVTLKVTENHKIPVLIDGTLNSLTAKELFIFVYNDKCFHTSVCDDTPSGMQSLSSFYMDFYFCSNDRVTVPVCAPNGDKEFSVTQYRLNSISCINPFSSCYSEHLKQNANEPVWCITTDTSCADEPIILVCSGSDVCRYNFDKVMCAACYDF